MANLTLGVWSTSAGLKRIKLSNIDLENKVQVFRIQALQVLTNVRGNIELSYCGLILEDENKLSSYGITDGVTIHVLEKYEPKPQLKTESKITPTELIHGFRTLGLFPNYRYALQRLTRPDVVDTILSACPELYDDPAAIGLIQDPELIYFLSNPEHASEMIEKHPVLLTAGSHILAQVREEQASLNPNAPSTSTGYSYSLDALSDDDEEMDSSDNTFSQNPLTRNTSFNAITAAQLAAAIANATDTQFNTNSAGIPTASHSSSNIITSEMFSNAIQQAINFGGSRGTPTGNAPPRVEEENFESLSQQWQAQLKQMHEMGLIDDTVNIRALRAVNGDVNAAIELVLGLNEMN
ncbi:unnamed protein product [Psylliodes chrysocephalus]|uniref:Ubiquitin-like protein 7 n=1 Tax=Psylliodes chrysocephalus TaxID=3402493 RepID=A0A9P0G7T8_9CUCU|nr:unnamed protein product [Psylliodes chrysocephala]